jgi:hypothetical protein
VEKKRRNDETVASKKYSKRNDLAVVVRRALKTRTAIYKRRHRNKSYLKGQSSEILIPFFDIYGEA